MHNGRVNIVWLADWSVLDVLPRTPQKLSINSLHLQSFDCISTDNLDNLKPSLRTFDSLVNLLELNLWFQGNFEGVQDYNMVVEGDLVLPSLQVLRLYRQDVGDTVETTDF